MDALVSVVIPTYNHAHFLGRALQSVTSQSYSRWEALVIDNHSHDNTDEVVASFGDTRIRIFKIHNNGVIAASRNLGIREAKGSLIAFLDSDDLWYPAKLERCVKRLDDGCDLVCHGEHWLGDGRDRKVFYGPERRATYAALLFDGNCMSTSAIVVRREHLKAVDGFREDTDIVTAEDYDLWLRLARRRVRIGFLPEILGEFRIHSGNESRAVLRNMEATMRVVRWHLAQAGDATVGLRMRARRREAIDYYGGARGLQETHRYREAWPYFFRALRTWPFVPKFYAAMLLNALHRRVG